MLDLGANVTTNNSSNSNQNTNASSNNAFNITFGSGDAQGGSYSTDSKAKNETSFDNEQTKKDDFGATASIGVGVGGSGSGGAVQHDETAPVVKERKARTYGEAPSDRSSFLNSGFFADTNDNTLKEVIILGVLAFVGFFIYKKA